MDKVESVKEWVWEDGYEFDNAYELGNMLLALKPNEVLCMLTCISTPPRRVKIRRLPDGCYRVSTVSGAVRFKTWTVENKHTITLMDEVGVLNEYINLYAWRFVKKDTLETAWLYDEVGD